MFDRKYEVTYTYGFVPSEGKCLRFSEKDLFGDDLYKYIILRKIKLWYGFPKPGNEKTKDKCKCVLGIQCEYQDLTTGSKKTTGQYCGELSSDDIEIKELELKNNDYFNKFNIDFNDMNDCMITHLKFSSKKGKSIEVGKETEFTKKTVILNNIEDAMIHSFAGFYDVYGLRPLRCKYIKRKDFIFCNIFGLLRLRHLFNINDKERKKWEDHQELAKLPNKMRAIAKLCTFTDEIFISVLKYLII